MTEIKYNPMVLDVLKDLSKISPKIMFFKNEDDVCVNHKENEITFKLKAQSSAFDFNGEKIGFLDYTKFYDLYKIFKNPTLFLDESGKIIIQSGTNKVNFVPSNVDLIKNTFKAMKEVDDLLIFNIDKNQLSNINKMIGKINPGANESSFITVCLKDKKLRLILSNKVGPNTFEMEVEYGDKSTPDIEAKFSCDILTRAPENDYTVSISETSITLETRNSNYELIMRTGLHYEEND